MTGDVVLETADWRGVRVCLHAAQWAHIERQHPEMGDQLEAIGLTIREPDVVTRSETIPRHPHGVRHVASRRDAHSRYARMYVRVPVEYSPAGNWVTTAYVNPLPPKGDLIYVRVAPR